MWLGQKIQAVPRPAGLSAVWRRENCTGDTQGVNQTGNSTPSASRLEWIDAAKGLCIALVALHHSSLSAMLPAASELLGLVRMPLFFFLSGIFMDASRPVSRFLVKRADAWLKPYVVVLTVAAVLTAATKSGSMIWHLQHALYGSGLRLHGAFVPLWFLPHLFLVSVVSYCLLKYTSFDRLGWWGGALCLAAGLWVCSVGLNHFVTWRLDGFGISVQLQGLPFGADLLLVTLGFFQAGYLARSVIERFAPRLAYCCIALGILVVITLWSDAKLDLFRRVMTAPVAVYAGAGAGIYVLLSLVFYVMRWRPVANVLLAMGRGSLFILLFHLVVQISLAIPILYLWPQAGDLWVGLTVYVMSLVAPLWFRYLTSRSRILALLLLPRLDQAVQCHK